MDCDGWCMSGRMKDLKKPVSFSGAPVASHREVNIVVPEDHPSKVGVTLNSSSSNAAQLKPKHLAWYVALKPNPSEPLDEKISKIPQVRWKHPPKLALNSGWLVAAGERSQEAEAQKFRETTVPEVDYAHLSDIPPGPFTSPNTGGEYGDDSQIPIIPTIPIEEAEVAAAMLIHTSPSIDTCNNSQTPLSPICPSVSGNLPLPHCKPPCSQDQIVNDISLLYMLCRLQNIDMEVAVAVVATVAAAMENKEEIDTDLLIKFLKNPEMVKKLIDERDKLEHGIAPPAPKPTTSIPLPSAPPTPVADKLVNNGSQPASRAILSNSKPQAVNQSLALPCTQVETAATRSALIPTSKIISPLLQSNSDVPFIENLTIEPRGSAHSNIHHIEGVKMVSPLMPSTLKPDEEMIKRLVNQYRTPDIAAVVPVASPNPSTSNPNMEAIKKLINEHGSPSAAGIRLLSSPVPSFPRPSEEEINKIVNKYAVPDHGWRKPLLGPNALLPAPTPFMAMPLRPDLPVLPNAVESNYSAPPGTFNFASFPLSPVDLNYHKGAIEQQVEKHESWGNNLPKSGQPGNYMEGLKLAHKTTEIDPKNQKPCIYFHSSTGCRYGNNCLYQHDLSKQSRASGMVEVPVTKKMRFS